MIKAAIFDMDGLLIDSEPLWKKAEIRIFGDLGINLTPELCGITEGLRVDEVVAYWDREFPGKISNQEKTINDIVKGVGNLIYNEGNALPGVVEALCFFQERNVPIALASASSYYLIEIALKKLNIESYFNVVQSAQNLEYGKPHPQVFIKAAAKLNVNPVDCLVFEDSLFGVLAGKAARMKVVAVPYAHNFNKEGFCIADAKIKSLKKFTAEMFEVLSKN